MIQKNQYNKLDVVLCLQQGKTIIKAIIKPVLVKNTLLRFYQSY